MVRRGFWSVAAGMLAISLAHSPVAAQVAPVLESPAPASPTPQPVSVRAYNAKDQLTASGWAIPVKGGYLTARSLLSNAARAEIGLTPELSTPIEAMGGEDVEGNLVVVTAGAAPSPFFAVSVSPTLVTSGETRDVPGPQLRCAATPYPLTDLQVRDIPVFGLAMLAQTRHREPHLGCPVLGQDGAVEAVVVWENPFGRPSVALVPAARAARLSLEPLEPWAEWRAARQQPERRLRDSLLSESLQDIWRGDYALAIEDLNFLLEQRPEFGRAWYYRGYARAMSGQRQLAMGDYENAVHYEPANAEARFSLGFTYVLLRRLLEAREQAAALEPLDSALAERLRLLIDALTEAPPDATDSEPAPSEPAPNDPGSAEPGGVKPGGTSKPAALGQPRPPARR